jgi:hypothetical protein
MLTPTPIVTMPQEVDIGVVAPGTVFSPDGKLFFIMTSQKTQVNLSNGASTPLPPSPFPVYPFATAQVIVN